MATAVVPSNMPIDLIADLLNDLPTFVDLLWRKYAALVQDGSTYEIHIPFALKDIIGQEGLDLIKTRFQYMIAMRIDTYEDYVNNFVGFRVAPVRGPGQILTQNAPELKMKKKAADKMAKVPRPPNAFILYRQHHHPLVKAEFPDMHNNQISIILGAQWKNETDTNKHHWNTMANEIKKKHLQDNPEYSYQPRKPSEKKRRMTRRKAAVLAGMTDTLTAPSSTVQASSSGAATAVQSVPPSSVPVSLTSLYYQQTTLPTNELAFVVPEFERTESGNAIVNIGDADLSDTMLYAMLDNYNKNQPAMANPMLQPRADLQVPIIYTEDDEDSAMEKDLFKYVADWDPSIEPDEATLAKFAALTNDAADAVNSWDSLTLTEQTALFDLDQEGTFGVEIGMMDSIFGADLE